jgi:hypothetical protein
MRGMKNDGAEGAVHLIPLSPFISLSRSSSPKSARADAEVIAAVDSAMKGDKGIAGDEGDEE